MVVIFLSLFSCILAYLVGAIPTGYLIGRYFFRVNLMAHGSGNIGATNAARVLGGVRYFIIVLLIDAIKAWGVLFILHQLLLARITELSANNILFFCAAALLVGNAHSVFLRFKGGKGVATAVGVIAYLIPFSLLISFVGSWLLFLMLTRQVFMASIGAMVVLIANYFYYFYAPDNFMCYFLVAVLYWIILRHKENISRFMHK